MNVEPTISDRMRDLTTIARSKWFALAADEERAELLVYGEISDVSGWLGLGAGARDLVEAISGVDGRDLTVRINSPGGDAFGGIAIMNALRNRRGDTVARVEGLAASAASIVAMGADRIEMGAGSMLMIHDASGFSFGPAETHEQTARTLDKLSGTMAAVYAARAGINVAVARAAMRAETWYTAEEAVAAGLADVALAAEPILVDDVAGLDAVAYLQRYAHPPARAVQIAAHFRGRKDPPMSSHDKPTADHTDLVAELRAQVEALTAERDERDGLLATLRAELAEAGTRVDALAEELATARLDLAAATEAARVSARDSLIAAAVEDGRIVDGQREHFAAFYDAAPAACEAALEAIPRDAAWPASGSQSEHAAAANVVAINGVEELHAEARRVAEEGGIAFREALRQVAPNHPEAAAAAGYTFKR